MEQMRQKRVKLLASDIDGTLLGDAAAAERFRAAWWALGPADRPLLVYNSGRMVDDIAALVDAKDLPPPDYMIGGVGTTIADGLVRRELRAFTEQLGPPLDPGTVAAIMQAVEGARRQADADQSRYKASWNLPDAGEDRLRDIAGQLASAGLDVKLIYSSNRDLDILPRAGGKGGALAWICRELSLSFDEVVVAGDTGNDCEMFDLPQVRGVVVANALPELRQAVAHQRRHLLARGSHADGVLEGLRRWGVIRESN
ncbi:HAD family hydrolase [Sinorhizobium sp. 7-81]|uniref:HAD family hydrolase n=1 Tax=Sinorhizobium sp. 8-89 TaxID=3049089 RepID=UPI0024C248C1|nr:HAD family hydrolase [Sinorhizobium sp. 8-89]MDK1489529.1 HAD family hydrolase [Sinorhizobium sp. 8-89]